MAYSQKVVDKFEETLNNPEKAALVDGSLAMKIFIE